MQPFRAHHIRDLSLLLRGINSTIKVYSCTLEVAIEKEVTKEFKGRADYYLKVVKGEAKDYEMEDLDRAVNYIGPQGENYDRFILKYITFFKQVIFSIHNNPEHIIRIQTDPSDICVGCWLAEMRKFGKHCIQDINIPVEQQNFYFPLYDQDVVIVQSIARKLGKEIITDSGIVEGMKNNFIEITAGELEDEFYRENGEFNYKLMYWISADLAQHYKTIGQENKFDKIYYIYNRYS
ncbi:MAG: hypothetical protein ABI721_03690 [Candidatus Dojkabacteria bacterium]